MITVNNKEELKAIINQRIEEQGPRCDLNDIDVSEVEDMSFLFYKTEFNGDISQWNTSNAYEQSCMFYESVLELNGKIPTWYRE